MKRFLSVCLLAVLLSGLGVLPVAAHTAAQSTPSSCPILDNGASFHARGTLSGNIYTVAWGDTLFSISQRFNVSINQLAANNGISNTSLIYAGQRMTIPCQGQPGQTPTITISAPGPGTTVPATFTVSGTGAWLPGNNLAVQAQTGGGVVLAQQVTSLVNIGPNGQGTWAVQLTVNVASGTAGTIVASAFGTPVLASVPVVFGAQQQQPAITIQVPAPGATLPATFTVGGTGAWLPGNNLVVQAQTGGGVVLAQGVTTLVNIGPNGQGTWAVQLTVNVASGTAGNIVAYASGTPVLASVAVVFGAQQQQPAITIQVPAPGATLPATFTVGGTGAWLPGNNLVVQAQTGGGVVLAQQVTSLVNIGPNGLGTWAVQLTVNVASGTAGNIVAYASGTPVLASVPVVFGAQQQPAITIQVPAPGATLPATFTVSGTGAWLPGNNLVVQAQTGGGVVLAQQVTALVNIGPNGQGTWAVQLTVNVASGTAGNIVAYASGTPVLASVPVVFSSAAPTFKVYFPGQCQVQGIPGAPMYLYPNGPQAGQFAATGLMDVAVSVKPGGAIWYALPAQPSTGNLPVWVPAGSVSASPGCAW